MLVANPFLHQNHQYETCPRIISELRKTEDDFGSSKDHNQHHQNRNRLSGELLVKYGKEQPWWPRKVCIRGGQLLVGSSNSNSSNNCVDSGTSNSNNNKSNQHQGVDIKSPSLKIPLRRLSLSAGSLPNSLSLIRGQNIVITLQTTSESSFDTWVKAIAIELIRQTPLEDIKYFDILTIEKCWNNKKDQNANYNCLDDRIPCAKCLNKTKSKVQIKEPKKIQKSLQRNFEKDLQENLQDNLRENIQENLQDNLQENLQNNLQRNLQGKSQDNLQRNFQGKSQDNLQTNLKRNLQINLPNEIILQNKHHHRIILKQELENVDKTSLDLARKHRRYLSPIPSTSTTPSTRQHEKLRIRSKSCNAVTRNVTGTETNVTDENSVEVLLKKCQNSENYVPVKEKLLLFETLCRLGRKVRSTEDVSQKLETGAAAKRAKSLHDLSFNSAPVKEICQYFETRSLKDDHDKDLNDNNKRRDGLKKNDEKKFVYSDSNLNVNNVNHNNNRIFRVLKT